MPAMIVWPVSWSVRTRKVGSSSARRDSAMPILSWSALVFGSTATWITGSGNLMFSSTTGLSGSQMRIAGEGLLRADHRGDIAGVTSLISSRWLACICSRRPMRSLLALGRVQHIRAGLELARVDAEVGQLAHERVGHDLEDQRRRTARCRRADAQSARHLRHRDLRRAACPSTAGHPAARADNRPPRRACAARPCS